MKERKAVNVSQVDSNLFAKPFIWLLSSQHVYSFKEQEHAPSRKIDLPAKFKVIFASFS